MNTKNGSMLEAIGQERAAGAETGRRTSDRTKVLSTFVRSGPVRSLTRAFSIGALGILLATLALVATATVPGLFGYHTYTIDGGSMEPTLSVGDAAVTKPSSPRGLEVGDVIVRRDIQGGRPVLHRIVEVVSVDGQLAFITQGDQNNAPDLEPVILAGPGDKVIYTVPYAGYVLSFAESWAGRLLLIGLPAVLLASLFVNDVQRKIRPAPRVSDGPTAGPAVSPTPDIPGASRLADQLHNWALRRFVLRHSGGFRCLRQCVQHPPISGMTTLQLLAALKQETGLAATSQRMAATCAELDIPFAITALVVEQDHAKLAA